MNHMLYSVQDLQKVLEANVSISNQEVQIRTVLTDSRKLTDIHHAMFFALKARRDGHSFLKEVHKSGIRNFVVSNPNIDLSNYPNSNFYIVDDSLQALQKLASYHRSKFEIPVIAITGSNGKTIVKEWLYQLLAPDYNIVRSPKSYNSQIGVPISVWEMNEENTLAIFEAGISKVGEMENLEKIIKPTIGILTNIGEAHSTGFESPEQKLEEKLKLFKDVDLFIYSCNYLNNYT
ncbi:MAG: Alanine racemase, partial [Daejeonella sp.]|nr:Alanine racemase [Daejeonella sp.]